MDRVIKYLPLLSAFLILLGIFRLSVYYGSFHIEIVKFLEFSEIITSFLDRIFSLFIELFFPVLIRYIYILKSKDAVNNILERRSFKRRLFYYILDSYLISIAIIVLVLVFNLLFSFLNERYFDLLIYLAGFYLVSFVLQIILHELEYFRMTGVSNIPPARVLQASSLIVLILTTNLLLTTKEVKEVEFYKKYNKTIINLYGNEKLVSDSNNYYIGNTKNYLFYHSEKSDKTRIIPMSRVEEIVFCGRK